MAGDDHSKLNINVNAFESLSDYTQLPSLNVPPSSSRGASAYNKPNDYYKPASSNAGYTSGDEMLVGKLPSRTVSRTVGNQRNSANNVKFNISLLKDDERKQDTSILLSGLVAAMTPVSKDSG